MDELTTITHTPGGYTITTGWDITLASDATRDAALMALFHRGFTPQAAVGALGIASRIGVVTVAGLCAD